MAEAQVLQLAVHGAQGIEPSEYYPVPHPAQTPLLNPNPASQSVQVEADVQVRHPVGQILQDCVPLTQY